MSGIKYLCFPGKSVVRPNWEKKFTGLVKGGCLWGKGLGTSCEELAMSKREEKGTVGLGPTKDPPISPKIRR